MATASPRDAPAVRDTAPFHADDASEPMPLARILVVDDDPEVRELMAAMLRRRPGREVLEFADGGSAMRHLELHGADLVLTDLRMQPMSGTELLDQVRRVDASLPVIIATAFASVEAAVDAIRRGAFDFVTKPISEAELELRVAHALERQRLSRELRDLRSRTKLRKSDLIIGESPPIHEIFKQIEMVAKSDVTVAISGESGTGKELVARTLHASSKRAEGPFVVVNCGALPPDLLENELFGHLRGAYTGAVASQQGLLKSADGGTVFLDEIGELSAAMQVKLLRFLQSYEYKPIGGTRTETVDVRVITATNRDLGRAVQQGTFREDLYYRINVVPIRVPPLRERRDDVPLLVNHLVKLFRKEVEREIEGFSPAAIQKLMDYPWPGNIRELQNVVKKTLVMTPNRVIQPSDVRLPQESVWGTTLDVDGRAYRELKREVVDRFDAEFVRRLLQIHQGNLAAAARQAGMDRKNLWTLVRRTGVDPTQFRRRRKS